MKRIHTFDEFEAAALRFRDLMRQLHGERGATENLPQCDRTLGLLVIARQETPHTGELARDVADMRFHHSPANPPHALALRSGYVADSRVHAAEVGQGHRADAPHGKSPQLGDGYRLA